MTKVPSDAAFGAQLAAIRRRAGLSQLALALEAGVSSRHISFLESGRSRPSPGMVRRLGAALRATAVDLERLNHAAGFAPFLSDRARFGLTVADRLALDAFEAAVDVGAAPDAESAADIGGRLLERIGIRHFATGVVRRAPGAPQVEIEMDRAGRPALGWLQHFMLRGYRHRDALVARAASGSGAFFWSDLDRCALGAAPRRILDEARDFRIHDGFVVAIPAHDGTIRAFTSWAERIDAADPMIRVAARLLATALIDSADRFERQPLERGLPAQQRALLMGVQAGHDAETLAQRLGVGLAAVQAGLRRVCADLGVETPSQAATRASALGLLVA